MALFLRVLFNSLLPLSILFNIHMHLCSPVLSYNKDYKCIFFLFVMGKLRIIWLVNPLICSACGMLVQCCFHCT